MRLALVLVVLAACGGRDAPRDPHAPTAANIDRALARAGGFLVTRQADDGGFRSRTYAALRDGWSVSPLVTLALRMTPAPRVAYRRAVRFVAALVEGGAARGAPEVSYPIYAYAIGALVLGAPENVVEHRAAHEVLLAALRRRQLNAANGWRPDDASFGGWGYAPRVPTRPAGAIPDVLTANLSATVLAVGALALAGTPPDDPALADAAGFVARCQNRDGGFFFSPALPVGNKAGRDTTGYRSYGSMTGDGVRALLRVGKPVTDPAVAAAVAWLERHFDPANNPGAFEPVDEIRQASSYYYWAWTAAHALTHTARDPRWAERLARELLSRQQPDGAWRNPATEMREDDPLVATSFAVAALALSRAAITGERASHAR